MSTRLSSDIEYDVNMQDQWLMILFVEQIEYRGRLFDASELTYSNQLA
jgi:hypothetical protein